MNENKRFFVALKGAIFNKNKFLIIKRSNKTRGEHGFWEFPGGRMEFGETPEETLGREVLEEVGLEVEIIKPLDTWSFFKDENTQIVGVTYLCKAASSEVILSEEHVDFAWVTLEDIHNYNIKPSIIEQIERWYKRELKIT
jgi:8-oxo-dGTP diphosphatase